MACYFVGDIQGCYQELLALLEQVSFDPRHDRLWLAGDLVARGPDSLATLRFVRQLGDAAQVVLGNHDLHLIAVAAGIRKANPKDKLNTLLNAPDCAELLDWLRKQPLIAKHPVHDVIMVHAGIYPGWSPKKALKLGEEAQALLCQDNYQQQLKQMYGNSPDQWHDELRGEARLRFIINAFTRMRYCYADYRLEFTSKHAPEKNNDATLFPWFALDGKQLSKQHIVFGHWASLLGNTSHPKAIALDTGCIWGNHLTMLRWEDQKYFTQAALS